MCSGAVFLIGLFMLFKGPFRVAERNVSRELSRRIALILMVPVIIGTCTAFVALSNASDDTLLTLDDPLIARVAFVEIAALVIAIGIAAYLIYQVPQSAATATPVMPSIPVPFVPHSIMTPAETAIYLRISEAQVRELINSGQLPAARIGDDYRIARIAVDDFLNHNKADNADFAEFKD